MLALSNIGAWLFVDNGVQTPITGAPFAMNNTILENRAKFVPIVNTTGDAFITVRVVDLFGVSAPVSIFINTSLIYYLYAMNASLRY